MTAEEERDFLRPWAEKAVAGGVLVLSPIRAALSQRLGRKIAPDTRHPKSDPQIQEDWSKNFRKTWRPC